MAPDMLDRIRAGDDGALAELLHAEWTGLVRFLRGRLDSSDAAQDATQETFVRLWANRERWKAGSARALVYRIAANVAADLNRKARVYQRWTRAAMAVEPSSPPTPLEELEESEARLRFRRALEEMAPKRQAVFRLVRDQALSYREVAEVLDLSPQTVANHMSLALRELRETLADLLLDGEGDASATDRTRSNDG